MASQTITVSAPARPARYVAISAAAALVAAAAAYLSLLASLPVWAMFMGWVTYSSRGHSARDGALNFAGFAIGLVLGVEATVAVGALTPFVGLLALPIIVLVVTMIVVSLRAAPGINNLLAYFLGLTTVFAAHLEPTFAAYAGLGAAGCMGAFAAWAASELQGRLSPAG